MKYAGKIIKHNGEKLYCSHDYGQDGLHKCYGLGKSEGFPLIDDGSIEVVDDAVSPLNKLDEVKITVGLDDYLVKSNQGSKDFGLYIKDLRDRWLHIKDIVNFYQLLFWMGVSESEILELHNVGDRFEGKEFVDIEAPEGWIFDLPKIKCVVNS